MNKQTVKSRYRFRAILSPINYKSWQPPTTVVDVRQCGDDGGAMAATLIVNGRMNAFKEITISKITVSGLAFHAFSQNSSHGYHNHTLRNKLAGYHLSTGPPSLLHPLLLMLSSTRSHIPSTTSLSRHLPLTPCCGFHFSTCVLVTPLPQPLTVPGTSSPLHPT